MKKILLTLLILSLSVLAACGANRDEQPMENQTENGSQMQGGQNQSGGENDPMQDGQNDQPTQNEELTAEEAERRALSHAQRKAEEVTGLRSEYDRDDRLYEVEFDYDGWEYEYKIHAISGAVLSTSQKRIGE